MREYYDLSHARSAAHYTTSVEELKELAYYNYYKVRYEVYKNPHSTEEIQLMTKAYAKFAQLTKTYAKFAQLTNDKSSN
jgi:hypothetical protein